MHAISVGRLEINVPGPVDLEFYSAAASLTCLAVGVRIVTSPEGGLTEAVTRNFIGCSWWITLR